MNNELNETFIGESVDCLMLGEGTIIEITSDVAKIYLEQFDEVIELPLDEILSEEAEELEELSNKTVTSYVTKSLDSGVKAMRARDNLKADTAHNYRKKYDDVIKKRSAGLSSAKSRLGIAKEEVELEEGNNKPYVKPHYDAKENPSGWKASNKHGNVKFFGKDFKASAMKHAGLNEEAEELEELSKKTLGSYIKGANDSTRVNTRWAARTGDRDSESIVRKRKEGISKAVDKLTKEEVEELDELSKGTLGSYVKKAASDIDGYSYNQGAVSNLRSQKSKYDRIQKKVDSRLTGINRATDRLTKEEVELEEGNNKPYVKPHYDAKENQSGWKASNKHGNVKFFGKDFKASAMKHAGLNEDLDESYAAASKRAEASRQRAIKNAAKSYKSHGDIDKAIRDHDLFARDAEKIKSLAEENLNELSKPTLASYIKKAGGTGLNSGLGAALEYGSLSRETNTSVKERQKPLRKALNRAKGIGTAVDKLTKEEIELEEGRGRKPKQPKEGEKPTAAWLRHLERQKGSGEEKTEVEALGAQLRKAVSINKPVTFLNGDKKEITAGHANLFHDHMDARKMTTDKQKFQNDAHASHDAFMKAIKSPIPGR